MGKATIHILALDDNSIATHLEHAGYRKMGVKVHLASNWKEAERLLQDFAQELDLAMVNLESPNFDAIALIQNFQTSYPTLPLVATGIHISTGGVEAVLRAGVALYIEQPLPCSAFLEQIRVLLKKHHRKTERVEIEHPGSVRLSFEGAHMRLPILNLSNSGFFASIQGPQAWTLREGQGPVQVQIYLPGRAPLVAEGTVVRVASAQQGQTGGIGVRFSALSMEQKVVLDVFIREHGSQWKEQEYYL